MKKLLCLLSIGGLLLGANPGLFQPIGALAETTPTPAATLDPVAAVAKANKPERDNWTNELQTESLSQRVGTELKKTLWTKRTQLDHVQSESFVYSGEVFFSVREVQSSDPETVAVKLVDDQLIMTRGRGQAQAVTLTFQWQVNYDLECFTKSPTGDYQSHGKLQATCDSDTTSATLSVPQPPQALSLTVNEQPQRYEIGQFDPQQLNYLDYVTVHDQIGAVQVKSYDFPTPDVLGTKTVQIVYGDETTTQTVEIPVEVVDTKTSEPQTDDHSEPVEQEVQPTPEAVAEKTAESVTEKTEESVTEELEEVADDDSTREPVDFDEPEWESIDDPQTDEIERFEVGEADKEKIQKQARIKVTTLILEAEAQPQEFLMGAELPVGQLKKFVKNVRCYGKPVTDYTVKLIGPLDLSLYGAQKAEVAVQYQHFTANLTVPVTVKYGHTIAIHEQGMPNDLAISMLDRGRPHLTAVLGTGLRNKPNLNSRPTLNFYDTHLQHPKFNIAYGTVNQSPARLRQQFETAFRNKAAQIRFGDVVGIDVRNRNASNEVVTDKQTWVSRNERLVQEAKGLQQVYYELTPQGFHLLSLNRLTTKNHQVAAGTSEAKLQNQVAKFINTKAYPQLKVEKFTQFPKLTGYGKSEAVIRVSEIGRTGKKFTYDYRVPFETREVKVETETLAFPLGSDLAKHDPKKFIKQVTINGQAVAKDTYRVTMKQPLVAKQLGAYSTDLEITLSSGEKVATKGKYTVAADQTLLLEAEPQPQEFLLGAELPAGQLKKFVKNVRCYGKPVTDYTVKLLSSLDLSLYGTQKVKIALQYQQFTANLTVPVTVKYGHTIAIHEQGMPNDLVISMLNRGRPHLTAVQGTGLRQQTSLNSRPTLTFYDTHLQQPKFNIGYHTVNQSPAQLRQQFEKDFRNKDTQIRFGDVMGVEIRRHAVASEIITDKQTWVSRNEKLVQEAKGFKQVYYELTPQGFQLLSLNRLTPQLQHVTAGTSEADLQKRVAEFIDTKAYPQLKVEKFIQFPKLNGYGKSEAVIRVAEVGQTGKKYTYDYTVPFETREVKVETETVAFPLGSELSKPDPKQFIKKITVNGQTVAKDTYQVVLKQSLSAQKLGTYPIELAITLNGGEQVFTRANYTIAWGHTLLFKNDDLSKTVAAVSLLPSKSKPILRATQADGLTDGGNLGSRPDISIRRSDTDDEILMLGYNTVNQSAKNLMDTWNRQLTQRGDQLEYGQVLVATVHKQAISSVNFNGANTWVTRNERLVLETKGQKEAYYELTPNGLQKLTINLAQPKKQAVLKGTTTAELDRRCAEFLDLSALPALKVKRFVNYPKTDQAGETTGVLEVEETSPSGKKIRKKYSVPFQIDRLEVESKTPSFTLGEKKFNGTDWIKTVKYNGQVLSPADYEAQVTSVLDSDTIGKKSAELVVTHKKTGYQEKLAVDYQILWGNSIVFGCYDLGGNGRVAGAFTLHHGSAPSLRATSGFNFDNAQIHSHFPKQQYWRLDQFTMNKHHELQVTDAGVGDYTVIANGDDRKQTALDRFGKQREQPVAYGDVIRAWQEEPAKNWLYEQEQKKSYNQGRQEVYYEITTKGFQPLTINQLEPKKQLIQQGMTEKELTANIKQYLDVSKTNIVIRRFTEFPKTNQVGETKGKIEVAQKLTSGKWMTQVYEIPFKVETNDHLIDLKLPKEIVFGATDVNGGQVQSPEYTIENLSPRPLQVALDGISVEDNPHQIQLLSEKMVPADQQLAAKLQLVSGQKQISLVENMSRQKVTQLASQQQAKFQLQGHYFGDYQQTRSLKLNLDFQFALN